jgi:RNA polymerase sigma-70 factor (ECF subfamily)
VSTRWQLFIHAAPELPGLAVPDGLRARSLAGPADRLTDLYRTYAPVIYGRCRRILGESAAAQDATQETFLRVYRHLDCAPEQALRWIYRIATNYCLNELRDRRLRPLPCAELPEPVSGSLQEEIADRQLAGLLLERVPRKLRSVAWLHYVDGLGGEEIARVLGVSRRTVGKRLAAFRDRTRKYLGRLPT